MKLADPPYIRIDVAEQSLILYTALARILAVYPVSTAKKGVGEQWGSEKTPSGWHQIRAKIGHDCPVNTVFVDRRPTGEIYTPALGAAYPERDWILTRILWLSGLEPQHNRFGACDTARRHIYIHGVPDGTPMGVVGSHGCIRMANDDIRALYDIIKPHTRVLIA